MSRIGRRNRWAGVAVVPVLIPLVLSPPIGIVTATSAAIVLAVALVRWPQGRVTLARATGAVVALSLVVDVAYVGPHQPPGFWLPFELLGLWLLTERVVRRVPAGRAARLGAALGTAIAVLPLRFTLRAPDVKWEASVAMCVSALLPAACAAGIGLYLRSLDRRRLRAVAHARRVQRLEVARDLHDFVAHEVTGILLEAQGAQMDDHDETSAREVLARIEAAGLRALDSMDRTVHALRGDADDPADDRCEPAPTRVYGTADLPLLVERFTGSGRVRAELDLRPELTGGVPRAVDEAVYFVVLEALTNVRRHAPDTPRVAVAIGRGADLAIEVSVVDQGGTTHRERGERTGGGTGLAALAARVEALDGTLTAGPHEGGWRVL
ncbi:histidine kinase, partial [Streptomyces sp. SID3343]|uniref:sensor histidine kinase n=1 Tax=Streptomyces sp. SID3343 TaxID=2690260 RepID=UPI001371C0D8